MEAVPDPDPVFRHWIDSPVDPFVRTPYVLISGWITAPSQATLTGLHLSWDGGTMRLDEVERRDVARAFPGSRAWGFQGLYTLDEAPSAPTAAVRFCIDGAPQEITVDVRVPEDAAAQLVAAKADKAQRIRPLLQCPFCRADGLEDSAGSLTCTSCGAAFPTARGVLDFLPAELRERHHVAATDNVSAWGYDERAQALIDRFRGGLVLDCGSGLRPEYLPDVVNVEITDYPTTDVLAVGQALPFRDASFDAVFSFAVLEHVADPFTCARELVRVLKPDGVLFAAVPFLQPFHGYPDHYYNMTSSGLRNLFAGLVDVRESGVPREGLPIFSLTWFLTSYLHGLDPETRARFAKMTVEELSGLAETYLDSDIVRNLSPAVNEELAATNYVIAVKPA